MPTLHIHLLGDFLLVLDDVTVTTVTIPRVQSLLAYLVLHRAAPQNRAHLAFLLWPDSTESQAHTNLRQLLYHLRQSLPEINQFLRTNKQNLQWLPAPEVSWTLDVQEFEQRHAQAEAPEPDAQRHALEQAMRLYRGELLPGCYEEWVLPERDRLRLQFLQAAERLVALLEEERDYVEAISVAHQLLRHDSMHEATYRQLMRLYALRGDRAAALRIYHTCATTLERELGTAPSEATQALYQSFMQAKSSRKRADPPATRGTETPLLGRKAEWRALQEAWRKAVAGQVHIAILSGEAGIGKTRLAEAMEAWVSRQSMATASARCYATPGQLAYAPVTSWLRSEALQAGLSTLDPLFLTEIARLTPEALTTRAKLARPTAMTEGWQRQQFFEALARAVLSARQPLLLLIDDLHWCDGDTLDWLHALVRFGPEARLLLIGTVRAEEVLPGHPLVAFLNALQREHLITEIPLGPLTLTEMTTLAEHITGHALDPARSSTLYAETEGNPLFVVEMARAGMVEPRAGQDADGKRPRPLLSQAASSLPPVVQSVLAARLAQLSPRAREVAQVAAVIGREFSFSVLARASSTREDALVQGLDELWQRRIVREQGMGTGDTYDFSHGKLREQVYASLSAANRRLLHRRVAEALQAGSAQEAESVSGQVAVHYECAGLPEQAIPAYQRAGELARRLYANTEAKQAFERAAGLLAASNAGQASWETCVQLYEAIGDVSAETGSYQEALSAYQRALTCVPEQMPLQLAHLQRKIANTWNHTTNNPFADMHNNAHQTFQEAERLLLLIEDHSDAQWREEWIQLQFARIWPLRGSVDDMTEAIEKARPIVEQHGTQEQRRFFSYVIATRNLLRDRFVVSERAITTWRATLAAVQQRGDEGLIGGVRFGFGVALLCAGHLGEAEEQLRAALQVGEQISRAWLRTRCLTFLPFIFRRRGQVEQVRELLVRAEAIGALHNNGMLLGHRAWLAWRAGDLAEAEACGVLSLDEKNQQKMEMNSFQWAGRWPLLGVALTREQFAEALNHARLLLDPTQQPPPEALAALLEGALHAWDAGEQEEARALLQRCLPLAKELGYL